MENSKQTIEQRVKKVISDALCVDLEKVVNEAELRDHLGADSLDTVEVVMKLEIEFDIQISDDELESLNTVQQHIDIVERLYIEEMEVDLNNENIESDAQ